MKLASLSDVAKIVMGQSPPSSSYNVNGEGIPFFQGKADFGDESPTIRVFCTSPVKVAEPGDILISVRAPVGPTNINTVRSCIGRGLAAIRCCCEVDRDFILHFLRHYETDIVRIGRGSTFEAINREDLEAVQVPIPPLPEQRRLAWIMARTDRLRRRRRFSMRLSDTFLQSMFVERFGDPIENPKKWDTVPLTGVGTLDRGRSKHRPRDASFLYGGPYPFIQTGDIANCGGYIREFKQTYSEEGLKQSRLWKAGTLCITIAANIAKTGILNFDACFPDSVVGFKPYSHVTVDFVQHWFSFVQKHIEDTAPEVAQKNINLEILRSLDLPLPPLPLQQEFTEVVQRFERLRAKQREAVRQAEHLFDTMLHRTFIGEL